MEAQEFRSAVIDDVAFGKREITLIAVPYNEEAVVSYRGSVMREKFVPGSFDGIESRSKHVTVNRDHSPERAVGIAKTFDTRSERGLISTLKLSDTPLGNESLQLAADGVLKASVSFSVRSQDHSIRDGLRSVYRAFLHHIALTPEPAYAGAEVLDVRTGEPLAEEPTPNLDLAASILRDLGIH